MSGRVSSCAGRPAVLQVHLARREDPRPHDRLPVGRVVGRRDLVDRGDDLLAHHVDDAAEDLGLVLDVVVERHRLDPELLAEGAHRQRLDAALVGDRHSRAQHALPRQRCTGLLRRLDPHEFSLQRTVDGSGVERGEPLGLVVERAAGRAVELGPRVERHAAVLVAPGAGDRAVDQERGRAVRLLDVEDARAQLLRAAGRCGARGRAAWRPRPGRKRTGAGVSGSGSGAPGRSSSSSPSSPRGARARAAAGPACELAERKPV